MIRAVFNCEMSCSLETNYGDDDDFTPRNTPNHFHAVAKPTRRFSHAMQILNHCHYSFLKKFIVFTVDKHENSCIA